jgi:hypothetical protein
MCLHTGDNAPIKMKVYKHPAPRHLTFCNDQIPHPKSKNEFQMPYLPQLSGGQMPHFKFNLKVNLKFFNFQLPQSTLVQPVSKIIHILTLKIVY